MIKEGLKWIEEMVVEEKNTALSMKSGTLSVFSTPSMIAFMELSAWKSVEEHLLSGQTTVGVHVKADHLKATPEGQKLKAVSILKSIEDRKLTFYIEVFDGEVLIGKADHVRYIVDTEKFLAKIGK